MEKMTPHDKAFRHGQLSILDTLSAVAESDDLSARTKDTLELIAQTLSDEISLQSGQTPDYVVTSIQEALATRYKD